MSDVSWIVAGYGLVYGAIAGYTVILELRRRRAGRRLEELR